MTFFQYMRRYKNISCPGRDLYEDMKNDDGFPKDETARWKILKYLRGLHACDAAIEAFENYWLEYAHECDINITALDCKRYIDQVIENLEAGDWHDIDDAIEDLKRISDILDDAC